MDRPYKRIGYNIDAYLLANNLTQKDLSKATGVPLSVISGYVRGVNNPSSTNLKKIARALGCAMDDLMEGVGE